MSKRKRVGVRGKVLCMSCEPTRQSDKAMADSRASSSPGVVAEAVTPPHKLTDRKNDNPPRLEVKSVGYLPVVVVKGLHVNVSGMFSIPGVAHYEILSVYVFASRFTRSLLRFSRNGKRWSDAITRKDYFTRKSELQRAM